MDNSTKNLSNNLKQTHVHEFQGHTTTAIPIGNTHIHYLESVTTANADHKHAFRFATLIDDPTSNHH